MTRMITRYRKPFSDSILCVNCTAYILAILVHYFSAQCCNNWIPTLQVDVNIMLQASKYFQIDNSCAYRVACMHILFAIKVAFNFVHCWVGFVVCVALCHYPKCVACHQLSCLNMSLKDYQRTKSMFFKMVSEGRIITIILCIPVFGAW